MHLSYVLSIFERFKTFSSSTDNLQAVKIIIFWVWVLSVES